MVAIQKINSRGYKIIKSVFAGGLVLFGFFTLLFLSPVKFSGLNGEGADQNLINTTHADYVPPSCSSCASCSCGGEASGGGGGCGCGEPGGCF